MSRLKAVVPVALTAALLLVTSPTATAQDSSIGPTMDPRAEREALRLIDVWLESQQVYQRIPALSAAVV